MAEYETKINTGALFVNDKQGNDKRPDRKGKINIGGQMYWLSGWMEKSKDGKPYLSLKAEPMDANKSKQPASGNRGGFSGGDDSF